MEKKIIQWREMVNVNSIELYKSDFLELIDILLDCEEHERPEIEIIFYSNSKAIYFNPQIDHLDNIGMESTNKIDISQIIWSERGKIKGDSNITSPDIVSGITIIMNENYVSYIIFSYSEVWFLGKKEQLNNFFTLKKPKTKTTDNLKVLFKIVNEFVFFFAFGLTIFFIRNEKYIFSGFAALTVILSATIPMRILKKEKPFVILYFNERPDNQVKDNIPWMLVINIMGLIVSIIGLFIK